MNGEDSDTPYRKKVNTKVKKKDVRVIVTAQVLEVLYD